MIPTLKLHSFSIFLALLNTLFINEGLFSLHFPHVNQPPSKCTGKVTVTAMMMMMMLTRHSFNVTSYNFNICTFFFVLNREKVPQSEISASLSSS